MRRLTQLLGAAALVTASAVPLAHAAPPSTKTGSFTLRHYAGPEGERDYWLYVPKAKYQGGARPLVVLLHGCEETAEQSAYASRFNNLADRVGFVVAYPQQRIDPMGPEAADGNGIGCWNWFDPADQTRGSGEPAIIAGITDQVAAAQHVDDRRIYVEGLSAGADMAVILGATYPDKYAAVAALAGCAYATCADTAGALTHAAMGRHARVVPMFVENGSADTLNNIGMASDLVSSWLGADELAAGDPSSEPFVNPTPTTERKYFPPDDNTGTVNADSDACVDGEYTWTCPGDLVFAQNYPTTVTTWASRAGCDLLEFWVLHGMEHAHPAAGPMPDGHMGPYTDPLGPDITAASYAFFDSHPMGACQ